MNPETSVSTAWEKIQAMSDSLIVMLPNIVLAVIVFAIFFFAARTIKATVRRLTRRHRQARNLGLVLGRLSQGIVILVGLFVSLSIVIPTFKAGDLVQLLGISGVAIGFAFRDILQNFLAGILILLTEPFQIDDQIVFKDFEGTVENIQTRATTIRTYDGRRIVIPNSELFTNSVTVNTAFENRRLQYDVGIGYGDDIDRAKQLILEAIASVDGVLEDPAPDALVVDLADSTVNIRARWWVQPP
ncbi:mechanosensitive ion channel family protein, partial [Trichocoleus sp. DQ-U1]|uniref:mechanosensitive ion channel family protein n=1 Tax=Trichocoleus sp. DQ-U1 TaxID=2933926 RepID=UPI003296B5CA